MPRMIDLIRARAVPATLMLTAARGALSLPAWERIEILLYLAATNSELSEPAKETLAQLSQEDAEAAITDPLAAKEVLQHLAGAGNLVSEALPVVLRNREFRVQSLAWIAAAASRENIDILLSSTRVCESLEILNALTANPNASGIQANTVTTQVEELLTRPGPVQELLQAEEKAFAAQKEAGASAAAQPELTAAASASAPETPKQEAPVSAEPVPDYNSDPEVAAFFQEHAEEMANLEEKEFQPVGGIQELEQLEVYAPKAMAAAASASGSSITTPPTATPPTAAPSTEAAGEDHPDRKASLKKAHANEQERGSALQKISKLDVKGRIQLAMKGNKEERSILVRDGTKLVALAVLDSPKITDGEVEKFASQRNVQEAVLRGIPMKRRFAKNYIVVRNLVFNPRMPIDLSLGLMKNLLVNDLKNLAGNKEVSETVRKLAHKMFKQKTDTTKKHS